MRRNENIWGEVGEARSEKMWEEMRGEGEKGELWGEGLGD